MKHRNPRFGCRRIAQQLAFIFGVEIDKDVVRRVLAKHYRPEPGSQGPSWLTFLGHSKDSLWSVDLFRCESLILRTHWVLVVMDQFTRKIVGFGVQAGALDGPAICSMFNHAIAGALTRPRHLSSDHDPLFEFQRWKANLRILNLTEIKTVPEVPQSHPFIERLVGTIRRELLDQVPFWSAQDLERKLLHFRDYYNRDRIHASLDGATPAGKAADIRRRVISSVSTSGSLTAAACISYPSLPDPKFATDTSIFSTRCSSPMPSTWPESPTSSCLCSGLTW